MSVGILVRYTESGAVIVKRISETANSDTATIVNQDGGISLNNKILIKIFLGQQLQLLAAFDELVCDVNSAYFHNHGGYECAKQFYADAYKAAVDIVGGAEFIVSAVIHADERNSTMSEGRTHRISPAASESRKLSSASTLWTKSVFRSCPNP